MPGLSSEEDPMSIIPDRIEEDTDTPALDNPLVAALNAADEELPADGS